MIVFISDIHFVDGTAGEHNIPRRAFEGFFEDIHKYGSGEPDDIKLVFLGDIFDLNRTTYWLDQPEEERPWGDIENRASIIESHANAIFDKIIVQNQATFDLLQNSLRDSFNFPVEPERIFVPGNHDRLCNVFGSLRKKVRSALGIQPESEELFQHLYDSGEYAVVARHGHEYDVMNYEGTDRFSDIDYAQVPIGDLITTEIASRLPYTIMKHVDAVGLPLPDDEKILLRRNLQEIENVRPYSALFDWLFYQVTANFNIKQIVNDSLHEIVENFNSLQYLERWYKRHDKWNLFTSDEADRLQQVLRLFKLFDVDAAESLMNIYSKIFGSPDDLPMDNSDRVLIDKAKDFLSRTSDYRYFVMGHSHNPMQVPVRITSGKKEQFYLNTGTWRKRYIKGRAGGFMGLKGLTYTILYNERENPSQLFETWTGSLKETS